MKTILISLAPSITLLAVGYNASTSKDSAADSNEQLAPTASRSARYQKFQHCNYSTHYSHTP